MRERSTYRSSPGGRFVSVAPTGMAEKKSLLQKFQALLDERRLRSEAELTPLQKFVHFWILLGRSFVRNRCPIRASALSYTTLLAMIPMLAVAISVTTSLLRDKGEKEIFQVVDKFISVVVPPANLQTNTADSSANPPAPASRVQTDSNSPAIADLPNTNFVAGSSGSAASTNNAAARAGEDRVTSAQREAANKIHEFVQNTQSGALGITGMVILVVIAIRMLSQIESTFNDIWGVTRGRNWIVRIVLYWTTITLGPLLLITALGLAGGSHFQTPPHLIARMPVIGHAIFPALTLIVLWLTFAMIYQLVPNTKVQFSAALIGGIVAGSLWHLNNVFGFIYVSRVVTNNKIYGSLFLVPVFMAGLYLTWFFLLFGAQVAYAFQNRTLYLQEKIAENVNQRGREFVALRLMTCIGQRFQRGMPPPSVVEMSLELAIPSRLVQGVLQVLIAAHLVTEVRGAEPAYAPARPLEDINAHHVLQAMRATIGQELITRDEPVRQEVYGEFARIQEAEKQAAASVTMLALVNRVQSRLELPALKTESDQPKMKPALVPTIEPAGSVVEMKTTIFPTPPPPDSASQNLSQDNAVMAKEQQISAAQGQPLEPQKSEIPKFNLATPSDEEREFPL